VPFLDYASELVGTIPELDILIAQRLVNRAFHDISESRVWSWLRGFGVLVAPQIIFTGAATVTQFSNTVSLNAAANTALNNLTNPLITQRQFRCAAGPMYNISAYNNGGGTLTLDRPYMESSAATQPYQVYRCYYQPSDSSGNLTTDFLMFKAILNPVDGYAIVGANLRLTRQELDARDPTRGAQDLAYTLASFSVDANGVPIYEMWPHPTSQRGYIAIYQKRGKPLSNTNDIPSTLSSDMLVEHSKDYAYDWCIANAQRFPSLKGVDWRLLKAEADRKYKIMLQAARVKDDELILDSWIPSLRDYLSYPPIDSAFMQRHDVAGWFDD